MTGPDSGRGRVGSLELLVQALANGRSVADAADIAGMSPSTAARRLRDVGVRDRIDQARAEVVRVTADRLTSLGTTAVDALGALLTSRNDAVRLGAVRLALDAAEKARAEALLERRLAAIEAVLATRPAPTPMRSAWSA